MKDIICRQSIGGFERVVFLSSCVIMSVQENAICDESVVEIEMTAVPVNDQRPQVHHQISEFRLELKITIIKIHLLISLTHLNFSVVGAVFILIIFIHLSMLFLALMNIKHHGIIDDKNLN